jgi:hypothetical protein
MAAVTWKGSPVRFHQMRAKMTDGIRRIGNLKYCLLLGFVYTFRHVTYLEFSLKNIALLNAFLCYKTQELKAIRGQ